MKANLQGLIARLNPYCTRALEGATDDQVREVLKVIISWKHTFTRLNSTAEAFSMRKVGG